ncbi:putative PPOX class F420-dependent enzyme family protein [Mycobacterium kansasii]|uniref:Putative PPOX class F420-dependent enzyme family protein n=1 Tax=Mycobacterium kansasii TaxID=1768 RepID=A0A1V3X487_MYCKA|nr:putative PPOX class F420-dependent enzyme family protein [Mycobacterium kansasii]
MTPTFADLAKARYILLTTFTKDGRPKPTPVWAALDKDHGDRLLVISEKKAWKVKRIRNTPRVTLAICDVRGRPKSEAVEAQRQSSTTRRRAPSTTRSASGTALSARSSTSSASYAAAWKTTSDSNSK